jgi:Cof subfamily protein (haloacid dehalogenase superfamily)
VFLPGLVASDLDGTLLGPDHRISDRTLGTLARLRAAEIPFAVVTGRPIRWLPPVLEQTGPIGPVVCANGAMVVDANAEKLLTQWTIPADVLAECTARVRADRPELAFAVERGPRMLREAHYPVRAELTMEQEAVASYAEIVAEPAAKLLIRVLGGDLDELYREISAALDGIATATHSGFQGLIEVTAAGVSKASGLAWIADHYGVEPGRVVAFGDMPNDSAMLRWAGRGVVVANGHPEAFAAADTVTLGNDADGVAVYLDELLDQAAVARLDHLPAPLGESADRGVPRLD